MNSYYSPTFQRKAFTNAERKRKKRQESIERSLNPIVRPAKEKPLLTVLEKQIHDYAKMKAKEKRA